MQLSQQTIGRLKEIVTGDHNLFPRHTAEELTYLFNDLGFNDVCDSSGSLPNGWTRKEYARERLKELNGKKSLQILLENVVANCKANPDLGIGVEMNVQAINSIISFDKCLMVSYLEHYGK